MGLDLQSLGLFRPVMRALCKTLEKYMREFLVQQFSHFELEDVYPGKELKCALFIFCAWAIPAFSFVLWAEHYYPTVEFFQSAITEGIGPNLWNALGAFGLFMLGLSIIFLNFNFPALVAEHIL